VQGAATQGEEDVRAEIDPEKCLGYGECAAVAPDLFVVGDDELAHAQGDERAWADVESARLAMTGCPTRAITLIDAAAG
jgi:ferredoxin